MFFSKNDINSKDWMDVVFANRNKEYGAYELRQYSSRATNIAVALVFTTVGGLCSLSFIESKSIAAVNIVADHLQPNELIFDTQEPMEVLIEEIKTEQLSQVAKDVSSVDLLKFTEINPSSRASTDDLATIEETMDKKVMLASLSMKGEVGGTLVPKGAFGKKKQEGSAVGASTGDITGSGGSKDLFISVEIMPEPPGGMKAFVQWVAQNYKFSESAIQNEAKGLVQVAFVVEKDGSLSSFDVKRDLGYGTGDEAIRLLQKAKKWSPGIQNGIPVRVAYTLPIRLSTVSQ